MADEKGPVIMKEPVKKNTSTFDEQQKKNSTLRGALEDSGMNTKWDSARKTIETTDKKGFGIGIKDGIFPYIILPGGHRVPSEEIGQLDKKTIPKKVQPQE